MATYQVVCVNTAQSANSNHEHIVTLGLGSGSTWYSRITVTEAITQLRNPWGDRYYTISPSTGARAEVIEGECERCGGRPYVRTTADGVRDNNLLSLGACLV